MNEISSSDNPENISYIPEFCIERTILTDNQLWNKYSAIVQTSMSMLGSPIHIAVNEYDSDRALTLWTDHGVRHVRSVVKIIDKLYKYFQEVKKLEKYEIFVLLSAVYIHDLGMFAHNPHFSKDKQRKYHGRISGKVLLSMKNFRKKSFITEEEALAIALVSSAHQSNFPINNIKENIKIGNHIIRLALLGSVLRIADALDISSNRAKQEFLEYFEELYGKPGAPSVFEWNINYCCKKSLNIIENNTIEYQLKVDQHLKDKFKSMKRSELHDMITEQCLDNELQKSCNEYVKTISNYIPYYIADHVISLNESGNQVEGFIKELIKWNINNLTTKEVRSIGDIVKYRKPYYEILKDKIKYYWMPSANSDKEIENKMYEMRNLVREKSCDSKADIFMFLFDKEFQALRLWSSSKYYEDYSEGNDYEKEKFCTDLRDVSVPIKCGIVGFVAWMGENEEVDNEKFDLRASYTKYDRSLKLNNILFTKMQCEQNLLGIFLINFTDKNKKTTYLGNKMIKEIRLEEIIGRKIYYSLCNTLKKHIIK